MFFKFLVLLRTHPYILATIGEITLALLIMFFFRGTLNIYSEMNQITPGALITENLLVIMRSNLCRILLQHTVSLKLFIHLCLNRLTLLFLMFLKFICIAFSYMYILYSTFLVVFQSYVYCVTESFWQLYFIYNGVLELLILQTAKAFLL